MLDGYDVEVDQHDRERVVLAVPALRLIVFGRTLDEAEAWARAAITFRESHFGHSASRAPGPEADVAEDIDAPGPPRSHAA